ncbi:hypothetical protein [Clostridium perfringens]|uniref:hypothetical protein n=1 Tax=Clostridium perfringens TaxID=1502 RepID=UPI0023411031|nr:hypothetical protein [Clostridium perfringens]MDC4245593.1 hypothetical protein [Clostridium perfringens]
MMKVVKYESTDKTYKHPAIVFEGDFQECVNYYIKNKKIERRRGNYLEILPLGWER